ELGEIETALREQPAIRDAAVVVREDTPGDKRLVAYLVPATHTGPGPALAADPASATDPAPADSDPATDPATDPAGSGVGVVGVKLAVKRRLPDYMVPAAFVELPDLPLSPNGKLDRRQLPAPRRTRDVAAAFVAPGTSTEVMVAGIWAQVLDVPRV